MYCKYLRQPKYGRIFTRKLRRWQAICGQHLVLIVFAILAVLLKYSDFNLVLCDVKKYSLRSLNRSWMKFVNFFSSFSTNVLFLVCRYTDMIMLIKLFELF